MPEFIIAYHGGEPPESPEEGQKMMAAWGAWIKELGPKLTNPGTPLGKSYTVSNDGVEDNGGPNPLVGFSVVEAENIDEALEIAKNCPTLMMKTATLEVAEMKQMGGS